MIRGKLSESFTCNKKQKMILCRIKLLNKFLQNLNNLEVDQLELSIHYFLSVKYMINITKR